MEHTDTLEKELDKLIEEVHHHDEDDDDEHEHEHHHHHHDEDDDDDDDCCCHHHHDDDDEDEHEHEHHHHHHHHADEVFTSWGKETAKKYTEEEIAEILKKLDSDEKYGTILRAKGIVSGEGYWIHFDYIPGGIDVRRGTAETIGRVCVIGSKLNEQAIEELFKA
ncbi:MAG: GTP-binding protein, partial [bacterium]|nr:GTP-binding protein [bacterium]